LKDRSTMRGIEAPPEVGRRLGFLGYRPRAVLPKEPASLFETTAPDVQNTDQRRVYHRHY
jgi:hypothetical protein